MCFEASPAVFWSLLGYKELKLTQSHLEVIPFAAIWSRCKILACEVRACAKNKISRFGFKSDKQSWLLLSAFSPPFFFHFSCLIFFSCAGHWVGFILVGKVLRKAFKILGWGERKGRWIVEQDFHGSFQVNVTWFSAFFSGVLDWIVLILVWFERFLHSAPLKKLMTSQVVEGTWIHMSRYGRLRGEWVNKVRKQSRPVIRSK